MSVVLKFTICFIAVLLALVMFFIVRKGKITVKYSVFWFISSVLLFIIGIMPNFLIKIASLLGFQVVSNLVIAVFIFILILINISLTIIVSSQTNKINLLIQEISLLKSSMNRRK